jgi:hypothetical protein
MPRGKRETAEQIILKLREVGFRFPAGATLAKVPLTVLSYNPCLPFG